MSQHFLVICSSSWLMKTLMFGSHYLLYFYIVIQSTCKKKKWSIYNCISVLTTKGVQDVQACTHPDIASKQSCNFALLFFFSRSGILRSVISVVLGLHGRPYVHSMSKLIKFAEGVSMGWRITLLSFWHWVESSRSCVCVCAYLCS